MKLPAHIMRMRMLLMCDVSCNVTDESEALDILTKKGWRVTGTERVKGTKTVTMHCERPEKAFTVESGGPAYVHDHTLQWAHSALERALKGEDS